MCQVCGDARHAAGNSRRGFLRTGTLAALAPWGLDLAVAADPPKAGAAPPQQAGHKALTPGVRGPAAYNALLHELRNPGAKAVPAAPHPLRMPP